MGRKLKDPASHWISATQAIIELLGDAGRPEEEVRKHLSEGLDAAIGMYYASKSEQSGTADGQTVRDDQPTATEPGPVAGGH